MWGEGLEGGSKEGFGGCEGGRERFGECKWGGGFGGCERWGEKRFEEASGVLGNVRRGVGGGLGM